MWAEKEVFGRKKTPETGLREAKNRLQKKNESEKVAPVPQNLYL